MNDDAGAASLGHEVKLLVDMVVERSAPWLERVKAAGPDAYSAAQRAAAEAGHAAGQPCIGWCPICTTVNVARGQGPEFTARAFEQAAQVVSLLRAVLADRWHPEQGVHMPGFEPDAPTAPQPSAADAPKVAFGASNAPNATLGTPPPPPRNGSSPRVQKFAVRKAEAGEQQP